MATHLLFVEDRKNVVIAHVSLDQEEKKVNRFNAVVESIFVRAEGKRNGPHPEVAASATTTDIARSVPVGVEGVALDEDGYSVADCGAAAAGSII